MKKYGHIISKLRKKQGLTQEQLGKELNVSYQAVSKWENNLSEPDLETIEKLTEVFGISISDFFELANNPENIDNNVITKENNNIKKNDNINEDKNIKKRESFIQTKPWYLVAGLGILIVILSLCAFLIPVKFSGKQLFDKYKLVNSYDLKLEELNLNIKEKEELYEEDYIININNNISNLYVDYN